MKTRIFAMIMAVTIITGALAGCAEVALDFEPQAMCLTEDTEIYIGESVDLTSEVKEALITGLEGEPGEALQERIDDAWEQWQAEYENHGYFSYTLSEGSEEVLSLTGTTATGIGIGTGVIEVKYTYVREKDEESGTEAVTTDYDAGTVTITVREIEPEQVTLSDEKLTLEVGESKTVTAEIAPENATNQAASFSSSDETVATVDGNGTIKAVKAGKAVITVTAQGNEAVTAEIAVTVKEPEPEEEETSQASGGSSSSSGSSSSGSKSASGSSSNNSSKSSNSNGGSSNSGSGSTGGNGNNNSGNDTKGSITQGGGTIGDQYYETKEEYDKALNDKRKEDEANGFESPF